MKKCGKLSKNYSIHDKKSWNFWSVKFLNTRKKQYPWCLKLKLLHPFLSFINWINWSGGGSFFCNHLLFFLDYFEQLQTVLFEVELIINNAPLIYPNTIKTCLTPNHLLFGRQLLYSSNTTWTVVRNVIVLSKALLIRWTASVIIFWVGGDMNM